MDIAGAIKAVFEVISQFFNYFKKTPEQKKHDELKESVERDRKGDAERKKAIEEGKKGDTSGLEEIINRL